MCSTISLVALATSLLALPQSVGKPTWSTDYALSRKMQQFQHRPLAVFVGSGTAGWRQISRSGNLTTEAERILSQRYVCVYADRATATGKELAAAFEIADGPGLVISDSTGKVQAFHHEGSLSDEGLTHNLQRYADPERVARVTETVPPPAPVYQAPATNFVPAQQFQGGYPSFGGSFGGFGGGFGGGRGGC